MEKSPHPVARLQRAFGNRAIQRHLREERYSEVRVSEPDDRHEREADRAAGNLLSNPGSESGVFTRGPGRSSMAGETLPTDTAERLRSLGNDGRSLPIETRTSFERRSRRDLSDVRVHTGGIAARIARSINARAFAFGRDIGFGHGAYRPETETGRELLAHELTHVTQHYPSTGPPDVVYRRVNPGQSRLSEPSGFNVVPDADTGDLTEVLFRLIAELTAGERIAESIREARDVLTEAEAAHQAGAAGGTAVAERAEDRLAERHAAESAEQLARANVATDVASRQEVLWIVTELASRLETPPGTLRKGIVELQLLRGFLRGEAVDVGAVAVMYEDLTGEALLETVQRVYGPTILANALERYGETLDPDSDRSNAEPSDASETSLTTVISDLRAIADRWTEFEQRRRELETEIGSGLTTIQSSPRPEHWELRRVERSRGEFQPESHYSGEFRHINPGAIGPMPYLGRNRGIRYHAFGALIRKLNEFRDREIAAARGDIGDTERPQEGIATAVERAEEAAELTALEAEARETALEWARERMDPDEYETYRSILEDEGVVVRVPQTHWKVEHEAGEVFDLRPPSPSTAVDRPTGYVHGGSRKGEFGEEVQEEALQQVFDDEGVRERGQAITELLVQNEGRTDSINTYDRATVTVGAGIAAQGVMQEMYWRFAQRAPAEFHELLGRYGIGVHERGSRYELSAVVPERGVRVFGDEAQAYIAEDPHLLAAIRRAGRDPRMKTQMLVTVLEYTAKHAIEDFALRVQSVDGERTTIGFHRLLDALESDDLRTAVEATIADRRHHQGHANNLRNELSEAYAALTAERGLAPPTPEDWPEDERQFVAEALAARVVEFMNERGSRARAFRLRWPDIFE